MINKGHGLIGLQNASLATTMDAFTLSLAKKCERLATASYLVTSFLSDTEPLKARLRALALDLVRDASLARNGTVVSETEALEILRANINETLSLLELAFINGLISEMNFSILKREYASLRDAVEIKKASRESRSDNILGDNFFGAPEPVSAPKGQRSGLENLNLRPDLYSPVSAPALKPIAPMSDRNPKGQQKSPRSDLGNFGLRSVLGDQSKTHKGHEQKQSVKENIASNVPNIQRDSRHARILKLIKDKREVAIKDIVEHFPDLSEKTIQRDLVSFTESGILKKSGDRRWSRYKLA